MACKAFLNCTLQREGTVGSGSGWTDTDMTIVQYEHPTIRFRFLTQGLGDDCTGNVHLEYFSALLGGWTKIAYLKFIYSGLLKWYYAEYVRSNIVETVTVRGRLEYEDPLTGDDEFISNTFDIIVTPAPSQWDEGISNSDGWVETAGGAAPTWTEEQSAAPSWTEGQSAAPTWTEEQSTAPSWTEGQSTAVSWTEATSNSSSWTEEQSGAPSWAEEQSSAPNWSEETSTSENWTEGQSSSSSWSEES